LRKCCVGRSQSASRSRSASASRWARERLVARGEPRARLMQRDAVAEQGSQGRAG
jgi:hypothetical protein